MNLMHDAREKIAETGGKKKREDDQGRRREQK
jgi:hypothetical protein